MKVRELFDLSGRTALVTGGLRALGLAMAAALAEMGARMAITAREIDELSEAQDHLRSEGHEVATLQSDLSKTETAQPLVEGVVSALSPIDILVNNAGPSWGAPARHVTGQIFSVDAGITAV